MAKKLTQISIDKVKADPTKRIEIPDGGQSHLYLVVQPSGAKSWAVRYRLAGKPKKFTLPFFVSLADAREHARDVLGKVSRGEDPSAAVPAKRIDLFKDIVSEFRKRHLVENQRSASYTKDFDRRMKKDVLPTWGERDIKTITKRDVVDLLDAVTDRVRAANEQHRGLSTNTVFSMLRSLFTWAVGRDVIEISPMVGIKKPMDTTTSRDRVLDDKEIAALWRAADAVGYPAGDYVKMLLLTGQRRTEVAAMTWSEIKDGVWTIPGERSKNGEPNKVPLSGAVIELLKGLPRIEGKFVFTASGKNPLTTNGKPKAKLDVAIGDAISDWTFHDLRRTCASGMAKLHISVETIEAVLNHTSGKVSGIARVYNRHDYADEKRGALEAWSRYVLNLVQPVEKNIVPLRRA
jgi:integrase